MNRGSKRTEKQKRMDRLFLSSEKIMTKKWIELEVSSTEKDKSPTSNTQNLRVLSLSSPKPPVVSLTPAPTSTGDEATAADFGDAVKE